MMNRAIFEEKWALIRGQINAKWSLMVEYDLIKVDKADVKFDKFTTMLQVKYGNSPPCFKLNMGIPVRMPGMKSASSGQNTKPKTKVKLNYTKRKPLDPTLVKTKPSGHRKVCANIIEWQNRKSVKTAFQVLKPK